MIFTREHLLGTGYEWNLSENTHKLKEMNPTRNRFDRFNGNCVLHMLNLFSKLVANLSVKDGQHLEQLISKELPLMLTSELSVFNWLKGKYIYASPVNKLN